MNEVEDAGEDGESERVVAQSNNGSMRDHEWASELRRADERTSEMRARNEQLTTTNLTLEAKIKKFESSIEVRDVEILRLGGLYQCG
jgi:hypothetical protein